MHSADLDLAAAEAAMRSVAGTADAYEAAWHADREALAAATGALGSGVLGQAFRPRYTESEAALRAAADRVPGVYRRFAKAGTDSVADYRLADAASARGFGGG
ncbi:hypothetical protein [Crossiella sp. NPDC003009]